MKITKREKMLLFFVVLIGAITLSVIFGLIPMLERLDVAQAENESLTDEVALVRDRISNRTQFVNEYNEANNRFEELKRDYPEMVSNEEIDSVLTNLCLDNGLRPTSWRVRPFTSPGRDDLFVVITVVMNVSGTYDSFMSLLDEVDSKQFLRITNMSYSIPRAAGTVDPIATIALTFELTYINPQ
ncbi:MAG: type 4a pilus biogenesis protein PilO [Oscillospiraceae bacterium]|jgi:Tfp pilus assembly protein PilO|nr:type 4a pilus biogenesis protein PilO [Oscillospiraceae bacterium]